ncbi:hypothetical protein [Sphingopyxis sp. Geo48]|uniref:hypothetical protein n=1 Tax=Sphingopyxis sp. Geo48 TaxID=545241 RepID=UPI0024B703EE|nr:hypothetical protein [Sphingopyxis sp. Geo48]
MTDTPEQVGWMPLSDDERRIVDWLRAEYAGSCERQEIPANAITMIDTIRHLIENGAHR